MSINLPLPLFTFQAATFPSSATPATPGRHLRLVSSGRHGAPGAPGNAGYAGGPGSVGGAGQPGVDAAPIALSLHVHKDSVVIASHSIARHAPVESPLRITDQDAAAFLEAVGGDGGAGGVGGAGGRGSPGASGRNATRYSSATPGGPGQDGGRGGHGGRGGDSGSGGNIDVDADVYDMDLFMLIKAPPHAVAGRPGIGGAGGPGGMGGLGGPGGRGCSWTESETYYQNGQAMTRTIQRSQPGAPSGPNGRNGPPGLNGANGERGLDGMVVFHVNGLGAFPWRYDLRVCPDVSVRDELGVGVLQPGGFVCMGYSVENCGAMPTPLHQDVLMSAELGRWIKPCDVDNGEGEGGVQTLPRAIAPQSAVRLPEPLRLLLTDIVAPIVGDPLYIHVDLQHRALVTRINQCMPLVANQGTRIGITFPLHVSHMFGNVCTVRGGEAIVAWKVLNVSEQPVGPFAPVPREGRVRFSVVDPSERDVVDDQGRSVSAHMLEMGHLEQATEMASSEFQVGLSSPVDGTVEFVPSFPGQITTVRNIEAGTEAGFICTVRLQGNMGKAALTTHSQACLTTTLDLGHPRALSELQPIQTRPFQVQLAEPFLFHHGETKVLLVVNNRTTHTEIAQWKALMSALMDIPKETGIALWNVSLYGGFSYKYKVTVSKLPDKQSLGSLFSGDGSLVVFLNNSCTPTTVRTNTSQACPMQYLKRHEPLDACKYYRCSSYILGSDSGVELRARIRVPVGAEKFHEFEDIEQLLNGAIPTLVPASIEPGAQDSQRSAEPHSSSAAWLESSLKGFLYKNKQKGSRRVKRVFVLRKQQGALLYYRKMNSKKPSAVFQLSKCSLVAQEEDTVSDKKQVETLTVKTPSRELKLTSVTIKGACVGPSLAEWRAEIIDGIAVAKADTAASITSISAYSGDLDAEDLRDCSQITSPDFDTTTPFGYDGFCGAKFLTRQMKVSEKMLRNRAVQVAESLAGKFPEYPCLVVHKYVQKSDQEKNSGIMFNKRNIGDIFVRLGLPLGHGNVVSHCLEGDGRSRNSFVHSEVLSQSNVYGTLKSLPIAEKIRLLQNFGQDGTLNIEGFTMHYRCLDLLIDAILSDAADEQACFRFGNVTASSKLHHSLRPSKRRSTAQSWASRMACLSAICGEEAIGIVKSGTKKFESVFRLCTTLRFLVRASVPMTQCMLKVSRVGMIARAADMLLKKLEANFATAIGLEKAGKVRNEEGVSLEKCVSKMMRGGLADGNDVIMGDDILSYLRCRYGFGVADASAEKEKVAPIVMSFEEFRAAKEQDRITNLPMISMKAGLFETDMERQQALSNFLSNWCPNKEEPMVSL